MIAKPTQTYPVKLGDKTFNLSLADIIYDAPKGEFPHPNTMTCKLMAGDKAVYELEYYSPGGGFYEWKGYTPPKKGQPKYPYATMKELRQHAEKNKLSIAQVIMANEVAVSGKTEEQINAFLDKIASAMLATVKAGLAVKEGVLPGPIKLHSKAATVFERAQDDKYESDRAIALVSAFALAASEENARGHLVITAPTGGSAGVMPAIVYALVESKRKLPKEKVREGLLAGAAIGYLCKHNATLSGAEGGCQSEIGVASAMSAAFIAQVMDSSPLVIENAAESALEHHLGMTCDPVAGYVQVPCIERCAFGAVKAWIAFMIATNEIASRHRVDLDTTIKTLAETGRDMSSEVQGNQRSRVGREPRPLLKRDRAGTARLCAIHGCSNPKASDRATATAEIMSTSLKRTTPGADSNPASGSATSTCAGSFSRTTRRTTATAPSSRRRPSAPSASGRSWRPCSSRNARKGCARRFPDAELDHGARARIHRPRQRSHRRPADGSAAQARHHAQWRAAHGAQFAQGLRLRAEPGGRGGVHQVSQDAQRGRV